jgi:hypothetical protein
VWGSLIGVAGATVFVFSYRNGLPAPWPMIALVAWLAGIAAYAWTALAVPRALPALEAIGRRAGVIYLASVAAMLVVIRVGTIVLDSQQLAGLRPALIVLAVGLHFLPFAGAFRTPMFTTLGLSIAGLGAAGLLLGWLWARPAASAAAVLAGLVMLTMLTTDAGRGRAKGRHG